MVYHQRRQFSIVPDKVPMDNDLGFLDMPHSLRKNIISLRMFTKRFAFVIKSIRFFFNWYIFIKFTAQKFCTKNNCLVSGQRRFHLRYGVVESVS